MPWRGAALPDLTPADRMDQLSPRMGGGGDTTGQPQLAGARRLKFACEKCAKRYSIPDDKVRGRVLKVRCKACDNVIVIKETSGIKDEAPVVDASEESTRMMSADEMRKLQGGTPGKAGRPDPPPPVGAVAEWFLMIEGRQVGPMVLSAVRDQIGLGKVSPRTYVWKDGMGDWKRAFDVPPVHALFPAGTPPPAPKPTKTLPPTALPELLKQEKRAPTPPPLAKGAPPAQKPPPIPAKRAPTMPAMALVIEDQPLPAPAAIAAPKPASGGNGAAGAEVIASPGKLVEDPILASLREPFPPAGEQKNGTATSLQGSLAEETDRHRAQAPQDGPPPGESTEKRERHPAASDLASLVAEDVDSPTDAAFFSSEPQEQPEPAEAPPAPAEDPFAAVASSAKHAPMPHQESTRFFIAQAGVNKRNSPLKIAAWVGGAIALLALAFLGALQIPSVRAAVTSRTSETIFDWRGNDRIAKQLEEKKRKEKEEEEHRKRTGPVGHGQPKEAPVVERERPKATPLGVSDKRDLDLIAGKADAKPTLEVEKPQVDSASAGLSGDEVAKVFGNSSKAFESCIGDSLRRDPNQKLGKVRITLTIHPSGVSSAPRIDNKAVDGADLGLCLKAACKRMVFPSFAGEAFDVEIPLVLGRSY